MYLPPGPVLSLEHYEIVSPPLMPTLCSCSRHVCHVCLVTAGTEGTYPIPKVDSD